MYKFIADNVIAFDAEWVPDPDSGRRIYDLPASIPDAEVIERMWVEGGATPEDPRPYLKTVMCRIVSLAAVIRKKSRNGELRLKLHSLPGTGEGVMSEKEIVSRFLEGIGKSKSQIVGFNSINSDLPILLQRGLASGACAPAFCERPPKPWEGVDYFTRYSDFNIDLKDVVGGYGKATPSLHELATVLRIPGKLGTSGGDVAELWENGEIETIVEYNQYDALTTYLVWLRTVFFSGHLTEEEFQEEERALENLLSDLVVKGEGHLVAYLEKWRELRGE